MQRSQRQPAAGWAQHVRCGLAGAGCVAASPAFALDVVERLPTFDGLRDNHDVVGLSLIVGLVLFSTITALLHLAGRQSWTRRETALASELATVRARLDRAEVFLAAEPHITVVWTSSAGEPEIEGELSLATDMPVARRLLGFGTWLPPHLAQKLDHHVERLRSRGESFRMPAENLGGRHLEIEGRAVSGRAVMRIRDVSGDRLEAARLRESQTRTLIEIEALRALLNGVASPSWARDEEGRLRWVNAAYVAAVEAQDMATAVLHGAELLDRPVREMSQQTRAAGEVWRGRVPVVVAGARRMFDVLEVPVEGGSVGLAFDVSEAEALRGDLARLADAHSRTLDQLSTAVAIFDRSQRLVFHNAAYRELWGLEQSFVDQKPTDSEIMDRLRGARRLPEQADYRGWRASLLAAYRSPETSEQVWYLPNGRTLRTAISPNPQGGVTYLFDDVTERFALESQFHALTRVQGETLDALKEGVGVFGTDGRLKFHNPAFARLLKLDPSALSDKPHIDAVAALCEPFCPDPGTWQALRGVVAGLQDGRRGVEQRLSCRDGTVLDCAAAPLPDGATLLTFIDTTASVNVERALTERNDALIEAAKLRDDFVHHVSYELRSPLTNIIGFVQLLGDDSVGPLNAKQREYASYVTKSSAALLAIINDILDLASIDTGAMELSLGDVDIAATMQAAAEGVQDRLAESDIRLQVVSMDEIGSFRADGKRIRQILFNLLSNAIGFSSPGQTVSLAALRRPDEVVFKVTDTGRGIPQAVLDQVFDRFHTHTIGSRHRGVGLGLSIVRSFVELHGGRITIDSVSGQGTCVTCIFPAEGVKLDVAATA